MNRKGAERFGERLSRRGISLPINVVVTAIVAVMVLALVAIFVTGGGKSLGGRYSSFAKTAVGDIHVPNVLTALNTQHVAGSALTNEPCGIVIDNSFRLHECGSSKLICGLWPIQLCTNDLGKALLSMKTCEQICPSETCGCKSQPLPVFTVEDKSPYNKLCCGGECVQTTTAICVKKAGAE